MHSPIDRRRIAAVVLAFVASVGGASSVSAETLVSQSGPIGVYSIDDSPGHPGARCRYGEGAGGGEQVLERIRALPPVVYARDVTAGVDVQNVRWRIWLWRKQPGGSWHGFSSQSQTMSASDVDPAAFTPMAATINSEFGSRFKMRFIIDWLNPNAPDGEVISELDWYKHIFRSEEFGDDVYVVYNKCRDYVPG